MPAKPKTPKPVTLPEKPSAAHTPGPWVPYTTDIGQQCVEVQNSPYVANDGWRIAECYGPDAIANARLIAAAPDLLTALQITLAMLYEADEGAFDDASFILACDTAEAAIAKAEGGGK